MNKNKRIFISIATAALLIGLFVAVWSSPLLQAVVFGVAIICMLIFVIVMSLGAGSYQGDNYH